MKAVTVQELGGPEILNFDEVEDPKPGPGEALVELEAIGVNFIDTYHRQGWYPMKLPFIPGLEAAGKVVSLGEDATSNGVHEGDRVAYCLSMGAYAERAVVETWKLVPLPDEVDFKSGAALLVQGMTAHYLTHGCYSLKAGDTALIHAAAGGVGLFLVQMAKLLGARVLGTVSTEEKRRLALDVGADHIILYNQADFEAEVQQITQGQGVEVVYESVGRATFQQSLNCLKARGYLVLFGQSSGQVEALDPQILNEKGSLFLTRPTLQHYVASRAELMKRAQAVFEMFQVGKLQVRIDETFALSQASKAHRKLESRKTAGKIILIP